MSRLIFQLFYNHIFGFCSLHVMNVSQQLDLVMANIFRQVTKGF